MNINIRDTSFEIDPFEHLAFWESIANGSWESETYSIIDAFCNKESVVLDLGSWAGPISLYAANKCEKVYALEPDPAIYPQLLHNVGLNPRLKDKIRCIQKAISNTNGKQKLFARERYGESSSSLVNRMRDKLSSAECNTITLKSLVKSEQIKQIDFIKMDIEGGEFEVLESITDTLSKLNYPNLYVSFHYWHLLESLLQNRHWPKFFCKAMLKFAKWGLFSIFQKEMKQRISSSLMGLKAYSFIYTSNGSLIQHNELMANPLLIKNENFLFTNQKWPAND